MHPKKPIFPIAVAAFTAALLLPAALAQADRIDGNWCHADGRTMSIDGPKIVTPGGTAMTGDYDRHGFDYTIPEGEPDAGAAVGMIQFDDNTNQVTTTVGSRAKTGIWNRCTLTM